jgi:D-alanine-D-alanine ligase
LITTFIRKDARETGLPDRRFRVIIVMASSLGYFLDESQDEAVLRETFRLLTPRGTLLLDLPDRAYILNNVKPQSWHEANEEIVVCRQRRRDGDMIYTREMVISKTKGLIRDATYCTRLYSPQSITARLKSAGFDSVTIQKGFVLHEKSSDYGLMSHRMIAVARKP